MNPDKNKRLTIALQKSGRLTSFSMDLLSRCGLQYEQSKDQLFCFGTNMPVDVLLVRDDDIPGLVSENVCDLGIAGLNVLEEKVLSGDMNGSVEPFEKVIPLGFGKCRLSIAGPQDAPFAGPQDLAGKRIATSYPGILRRYLAENNVKAETVLFSGAVEIAPRIGRADYICDLVSTGSTLAANHLAEYINILDSEAWIVRNREPLAPELQSLMDKLLVRIEGVQQVRESKYIMLHTPRSSLDEITRLLPGTEAPTVVPLEGNSQKVAVHAVCLENVFWETLENLKAAGASSILVLPVEKMLA